MRNKKMVLKHVFCFLLLVTIVSGCANNKYACKGQPDGVTCADPVTVYRLTEETDQVVSEKDRRQEEKVSNKKRKEVVEGVLRPPVDMAKPVLEPAQVLRIWVAPWVDESQDLHGASYVFTEITPRRWSFGANGVAIPHATYPFQVTAPRGEGSVPSVKTSQPKAEPALEGVPAVTPPKKVGESIGPATVGPVIER